MIHLIDHVRKNNYIPSHKHHASIIFQEFIPRDKPCVTPRDSFASNCVSNKTKMNLENVREFFIHNRAKKKNLLLFLYRYHGLRSTSKIHVSQDKLCTSGVTLGKSIFLIAGVSKLLA